MDVIIWVLIILVAGLCFLIVGCLNRMRMVEQGKAHKKQKYVWKDPNVVVNRKLNYSVTGQHLKLDSFNNNKG